MSILNSAHANRVLDSIAWRNAWEDADFNFCGGLAGGNVRRSLCKSRSSIVRFVLDEAFFLPSAVLYRRMVLLDDMAIRGVFNALPKKERDILLGEAKASVKQHGSTVEAHKARLLRDRYGIPRL